jgi:hypothetical protein
VTLAKLVGHPLLLFLLSVLIGVHRWLTFFTYFLLCVLCVSARAILLVAAMPP